MGEAMEFDTLIVNGTVVDPAAGRNGRFDVGVKDGKIAAVAEDLSGASAKERIDATGELVLPGMIDTHAHVTVLPMGEGGRPADRMDRPASEAVLRTLLAFGVTTVRNPAAPTADGVALREAVARGEIPGPTIRTAATC